MVNNLNIYSLAASKNFTNTFKKTMRNRSLYATAIVHIFSQLAKKQRIIPKADANQWFLRRMDLCGLFLYWISSFLLTVLQVKIFQGVSP